MHKEDSAFTDVDSTLDDYRAFSPLSLLALILALITGVIALVNASFVFLPMIAAVWAALTLVFLHAKGKGKTGVGMAVFALVFALICSTAPISYRHYRFRHLSQTAVEHAQKWLELVQQGKTYEPYQLTLRISKRRSPGTRLSAIYGSKDKPTPDFKVYLENEPEKSIRTDGTNCKLVPLANLLYRKTKAKQEDFYVGFEFQRADSNLESRFFQVQMRRQEHLEPYGVQWIAEWVFNMRPQLPRRATREKTGEPTSS